MRVDFYLMQMGDMESRWKFACQLTEKAWLKGHRIFAYCNHQQEAEYFDELLWTFQPDSFVPHHLQGEGPEPPPAVQIGYQQEPRGFSDILLNLADSPPIFIHRFQRIIEIVANTDVHKEIGREHYRQYRRAGFELKTHEINLTPISPITS